MHCISTDSTFFLQTTPPPKNASPSVISITSAAQTSTQAVSPESTLAAVSPAQAAQLVAARIATAGTHRRADDVLPIANSSEQFLDILHTAVPLETLIARVVPSHKRSRENGGRTSANRDYHIHSGSAHADQ